MVAEFVNLCLTRKSLISSITTPKKRSKKSFAMFSSENTFLKKISRFKDATYIDAYFF